MPVDVHINRPQPLAVTGWHNAKRKKERKMATGKVKWFNPTKGFGFIQPDQGGEDVFVHISALTAAGIQALQDGQPIEFELVTSRGRTSAGNLQIIDSE